MGEAVPALDVLTVLYDPLVAPPEALTANLAARLAELTGRAGGTGRTLALPVTFDGPDLAWCAERAGLDIPDFIRALCAVPLEVAFLGFTPGFAFLTGLPGELRMPRLDTPATASRRAASRSAAPGRACTRARHRAGGVSSGARAPCSSTWAGRTRCSGARATG